MNRADQHRRAVSRVIVLLFVLTIGASAAMLIPRTSANTSSAVSPSTTITSPLHGWQWDPDHPTQAGSLYPDARTVTVDQTENLVSQVVHVAWQNFSQSTNSNSVGPGNYPVHVYECDRAVPDDPRDCFGDLGFIDTHPGYGLTGDQTNSVQTFTSPDSTGSVDFDIQTGADNAALGCSPTHQCSLVVVPWAGGRPASDRVPADCSDHSLDTKFSRGLGLWASPNISQPVSPGLNRGCDWDARIVVPLSFAPTPLNCPSRDADVSTEGSPMMRRAVDQWRTGICNGGGGRNPLQVQYTGLSEYQARSDFDRGAVDIGLTSQPATDTTRKFVYAPVGVTSIAVAYYVDDPLTGKPLTDLKLSPRLIAKMLTQSYTDGLSTDCASPGSYACADEDAGNPASIFSDQEFLDLNPQYTRADFPFAAQGESSPNVVYGLSDNTHQVTQWLESDPAARAFLTGTPDENGMHVNTAYLPPASPKYPIDAFNANDPGHVLNVDGCGTLPPPINTYSCAVGGLQNNWFPINGLDNVAKTTVIGKNTATSYLPVCDTNFPPVRGVCNHYVSAPTQPLGTRSIFAIVSGGDSAAYQFPTAQLQTGSGHFVSANSASMTAALSDMRTDPNGTTQHLDYATLNDAAAYPLTTVSYAMVPTCGLSATRAAAAASFLDYTASDAANTPGVEPGQLAPGFLPMTAAMRAQLHSAAGTVASETACPTATSSGPSSSTPPSGGPTSHPGGTATSGGELTNPGGGQVAQPGGGLGNGSPASGAGDATSGTSGAPTSPSDSPAASAAAYRLPKDVAGAPAFFLPVVLCIGAGLLLAGPAVVIVNKRGLRLPGRR